VKVAKHRLGEVEFSANRKRSRHEDEDEELEGEEEEEPRKKRRGDGDDSFDEGSDSEGNNWTMGHVEDDEDSDIDSDEAFGESDEERFEGWVFRGSQSTQKPVKKMKKAKRAEEDEDMDMDGEIDLDEGDSADAEEEDEDDDFGDEGIDLATALDQYEESEEEEEEKPKKGKKKDVFDDSEPSEEEDIAEDGFHDFSSSDDEEEESDSEKMDRLKNLISSLPEDEEGAGKRKVEAHESGAPSEFGVMRKVDLTSLKPNITDPEKKKSLKLLQDDLKPSKRNDIARKLDAPLPKRQQDKLDRAAANEQANETLGRWVDTVKQNRRAEHISFPLQVPNAGESHGESRLQPTTAAAPANDLESTIQQILQQSGLSSGKDDEEQIQKWETLQTNKLPLEEVAKRRAELRKERELLFREEIRAKRVKKIKSKAYRRVHRKERERLSQKEKDALRADGLEVSEDEREYNDRRRAEERMGAKHRESRWAKGIKQSGRAAWDEDARAGVTEMARRNEELRRRIEGKEVREGSEEGSDFSSDEDDDDSEEDGTEVLQKQLSRLKQNPFSSGDGSKLGSMAFMQKAESARRKQNDEDVERMRKELAGEESNSEDSDENATRAGRIKFGPTTKVALPAVPTNRNEFEERPDSDEEGEEAHTVNQVGKPAYKLTNGSATNGQQSEPYAENPFLSKATKNKKSTKESVLDLTSQAQDTIAAVQAKPKAKAKKSKTIQPADNSILSGAQISAPDDDGFQTVAYNDNAEDSDDVENEGIDLDVVLRNQALTHSAFAGDNVEEEFATEKIENVQDEAEKTITTHLPGWGSWTGSDLTPREQRHRGKKTITKKSGIDPKKRKDYGLDKVMIKEGKVKKNEKYLAQNLPFPFETREQYERSLRVPKGPEWTTKRTFQDGTKPRVLVKQGVIKPMLKPTV
jgi:U3 small nucleolar RNA-associated protein 14